MEISIPNNVVIITFWTLVSTFWGILFKTLQVKNVKTGPILANSTTLSVAPTHCRRRVTEANWDSFNFTSKGKIQAEKASGIQMEHIIMWMAANSISRTILMWTFYILTGSRNSNGINQEWRSNGFPLACQTHQRPFIRTPAGQQHEWVITSSLIYRCDIVWLIRWIALQFVLKIAILENIWPWQEKN